VAGGMSTAARRAVGGGGGLTAELEVTAYCGCGRCCGWEYGIGLGPLPVYLPLAWKRRASGSRPIPLLPRRRRSEFTEEDRHRGAAAVGTSGAFAGCGLWAAEACGVLRPAGRTGAAVAHLMRSCLRLTPPPRWGLLSTLAWFLQTPAGVGAVAGAATGYHLLPVSRFWAETSLAGRRYAGTTATNQRPRTPVPPLMSREALREHPWSLPLRLLLLRWRGVDGTIAADTGVFPFGTRMHVPGYGWGVVSDRGSAVRGNRIDLFFRSHQQALEWGRRRVKVYIPPPS